MRVLNGIIAILLFIIFTINGDVRAGIASIWTLLVYLNWKELE